MKIQRLTDYAIRTLGYLYSHPCSVSTAQNIAESLGITYQVYLKISNMLKKGGLIRSVRGRCGGYALAKPGEEISLHDIILVMEGPLVINRCLEADGYCSGKFSLTCPVHCYLEQVQNFLVDGLSSTTIAEIWKDYSFEAKAKIEPS